MLNTAKLETDPLAAALSELRKGYAILMYDKDGREEETDMVAHASSMTPSLVHRMRKDAGGLVCVAVEWRIAQKLGIPFMTEVLSSASHKYPSLKGLSPVDIPYDNKSSFSITLNHRKTYTGVTDRDRALTIREIARLADMAAKLGLTEDLLREELAKNFRSPGHVHLLISQQEGLQSRQGHTELSLALARMAGLVPVTVVCEMLDGETGGSLSRLEAMRYAVDHELVFIDGKTVTEAHGKKTR